MWETAVPAEKKTDNMQTEWMYSVIPLNTNEAGFLYAVLRQGDFMWMVALNCTKLNFSDSLQPLKTPLRRDQRY